MIIGSLLEEAPWDRSQQGVGVALVAEDALYLHHIADYCIEDGIVLYIDAIKDKLALKLGVIWFEAAGGRRIPQNLLHDFYLPGIRL